MDPQMDTDSHRRTRINIGTEEVNPALLRMDDKLRLGGDFVRDCFRKLGPYIVSCHAKDIQMVRGAQVHFEETFAGNGNLNYQTYLSEIVQLDRDVPLMIEHSPERQQGWARDYIYEQADALGIPVRHAEYRQS